MVGDLHPEEQKIQNVGAEFHVTKRGGQVTYHGPGQLVGYPLIDLQRSEVSIMHILFCPAIVLRVIRLRSRHDATYRICKISWHHMSANVTASRFLLLTQKIMSEFLLTPMRRSVQYAISAAPSAELKFLRQAVGFHRNPYAASIHFARLFYQRDRSASPLVRFGHRLRTE